MSFSACCPWSPPKIRILVPTAHDEKLHLLGSTAPPTSLLVHLMSSSVTSFLASSRCSVAPPPPGSLVLTKWSAVDAPQ